MLVERIVSRHVTVQQAQDIKTERRSTYVAILLSSLLVAASLDRCSLHLQKQINFAYGHAHKMNYDKHIEVPAFLFLHWPVCSGNSCIAGFSVSQQSLYDAPSRVQ